MYGVSYGGVILKLNVSARNDTYDSESDRNQYYSSISATHCNVTFSITYRRYHGFMVRLVESEVSISYVVGYVAYLYSAFETNGGHAVIADVAHNIRTLEAGVTASLKNISFNCEFVFISVVADS